MNLDTGPVCFLAAPGLSPSPGPNGLPALAHGAMHGWRSSRYRLRGGIFMAIGAALSLRA